MDLAWEGEGILEKGINRKTNKCIINVDPKFFRPAEVDLLLGDPSKAQDELGWKRTVDFHGLVEMMVSSDYDAAKTNNII
jgi:GDPmannose 4,6-dehydratase